MTISEALAELLRCLKAEEYRFTAVTPATHARVVARALAGPVTLRDIFGWSRPFRREDLAPRLFGLLEAAEALEQNDCMFRSTVRVATLGDDLLLHSAFPTTAPDSVFFGPDTYRFARFLTQHIPDLAGCRWLVDMGAGSGAGAIAASRVRNMVRVTLVDVNERALALASVNAAVAGLAVERLLSDTVPEGADLVIANPPYMIDAGSRSYRDGGDLHGGAISLDWARQALARMAPGGTMLLYTGAAYIDGEAPLLREVRKASLEAGANCAISELDPDVFGDELDRPEYEQVERIAAVGAVITTARV